MSSTERAADDALTHLLDTLHAERDPVIRLNTILAMEKSFKRRLSSLKKEAAYDAALLYTVTDIKDAVHMDRTALKYLIDSWADERGLPSPARRLKADMSDYLDLRRR